jgi:hypothetical protein
MKIPLKYFRITAHSAIVKEDDGETHQMDQSRNRR